MSRGLLLLLLVLATGCNRYRYEVRLKPDGAAMDRTIRIERPDREHPAGITAEELRRLADLYAVDPPKEPVRQATFSRRFDQVMPGDIGGAGGYYTYASSLGTAHVYLERIRGQDDLLLQWQRQEAAIDLLVDLVSGWASAVFADEPKREDLQRFLAGSFRRDVKNVALYARWTGPTSPPDEAPTGEGLIPDHGIRRLVDFLGPATQYLVEREYIQPGDLPSLARAYSKDDLEPSLALMEMLRRIARTHLGKELRTSSLAVFNNSDTLRESFVSHVRTSAAAMELVTRWRVSQPVRDRDALDLSDLLWSVAQDAAGGPVMDEFDEVQLRLEPGVRPYATNGRWNDVDRSLTWKGTVETKLEAAGGLPLVVVALWSEPNEAEQVRLFGKVILTEFGLAQYCLCRIALTEAEAAQWHSFLDRIAGVMDPTALLESFRFNGQKSREMEPGVARYVADAVRVARVKDKPPGK